MKGNFETGLKIGKPVARDVYKAGLKYVSSECPLAGTHILQGVERIAAQDKSGQSKSLPETAPHPIELFARAYGIEL
jgi:glycerol-3-phosphate dehydrogenase subunit C